MFSYAWLLVQGAWFVLRQLPVHRVADSVLEVGAGPVDGVSPCLSAPHSLSLQPSGLMPSPPAALQGEGPGIA